MNGSKDIDLLVGVSLMPMPDGMLLLAALNEVRQRKGEDAADPDIDATGLALLLSAVALIVGMLALLTVTA